MRHSEIQFKRRVQRTVEQQGLSVAFAQLLLRYEDISARMEAYYWECDTVREVRLEKLQATFHVSRREAQRLGRLYETAKR
ncbi:hypothetical protein [Pontibacter burrus]|uniref:Uncharacterized protein n=1 Tax=Pontibacter burrus TaxID=2704466 RepID=A0A6B3LPT6_9BACT|nr:hypothetical protein [Pontibacter burrus]NEM96186.1 hypothetical protein [Pontibacter burrus]